MGGKVKKLLEVCRPLSDGKKTHSKESHQYVLRDMTQQRAFRLYGQVMVGLNDL